jgi:AraC family transcriptional regulator
MLDSSLANAVVSLKSFERTYQDPTLARAVNRVRPALLNYSDSQAPNASLPAVDVTPYHAVTRNGINCAGMHVELVQAKMNERVEHKFRSPLHLLAAYQRGVRRDGESCVDGVPRSTLRDVAKKMTFVPAGHLYREWYDPRIPTSVAYFYFDPAVFQMASYEAPAVTSLKARLFFEDATIWNTAAKLARAIDTPGAGNQPYVEALGVVLMHEIVRLNRGALRRENYARGGLAAWQQRIVAGYMEEHLSEQIPIAVLADMVRLSKFHFCRAFKQSFGASPHRYHTNLRIECAKLLLAERRRSVTEIGLTVGFSETSSFTAAFRKITGQTPSNYHRDLK